ncbi:mitochondrial export translocase-like protein Oxa1 [Xylogone sp. PMI_703]|nr:mitochondrial export translocase-like protein Oxa1 [Xylogone sp. PMI_703]
MIPSRGLRWAGQSVGVGRRGLRPIPIRQFSSYVHNGPIRGNPILLTNTSSVSRAFKGSQFGSTGVLIPSAAARAVRFLSWPSFMRSSNPPPDAPPAPKVEEAAPLTSSPAAPPAPTTPIPEVQSVPEVTSSSLDQIAEFSSDALHNIPEHIGYLKSLGLDYGWGPTSVMEWILEHVHVYAGTPWWASIALTAVLVRIVMIKPYIDAAANSAKLATIKPILDPIRNEMMQARVAGDTTRMMSLRQDISRINRRAGIQTWKSFVPLVQVFVGYGTFILLRGMSKLPVPGLETGGALWFYNLTYPDPYMIIPAATAGVLHFVMKRGGEQGVSVMSPGMKKFFVYGMPAISFAFTWWLPAAVQISFFVMGITGWIQSIVFQNPSFRRTFGMPALPAAGASSANNPQYKGNINIRATSPLDGQTEAVKPKPKGVVDGALKDIMSTYQGAKQSLSEVTGKGKESMEKRRQKSEREAAERYEAKRQEELKRQAWERENMRRAERAAKKVRRK